jgi:hypothetical protein
MVNPQQIESLRTAVESSGGPDKYIDSDEEASILARGKILGLDPHSIEAVVNEMCRERGWTREKDIIADLNDILQEATSDDGAIDQREFEHCVNYAVSMNMPRKRAMELCVQYIVKRRLAIKKKWLGKDWFAPLRSQYMG